MIFEITTNRVFSSMSNRQMLELEKDGFLFVVVVVYNVCQS